LRRTLLERLKMSFTLPLADSLLEPSALACDRPLDPTPIRRNRAAVLVGADGERVARRWT